MPIAHVNGINIHYERAGDGPDVIMIHGLAANMAFWYFRIFRDLIKDFRVTLYDLRGHGKSDMPLSGYTSAQMASDLHLLMDHLCITQAHLVGHSFGGEIALHYATLHPERALSLTLADARVRALQPVQRLRDWPRWRMVRRRLEQIGISISEDECEAGHHLLEEFAHFMRLGELEAPRSRNDLFVPFATGFNGKRTAERWLQLVGATTAREDFCSLGGLTREKICQTCLPVLAVYGRRSRCLESLLGLQKILPNCRAVIVPGAGHFHPLEAPGMFVQSLRGFLLSLNR
jgi:pimeloyl-ACP methyl ester carboxylesterase